MAETVAHRDGPTVLQVLPALEEGGVERDTVLLARYLAKWGCTPIVASNGGRAETELSDLGIATVRLPLHAKNPLTIWANIGRLQRLVHVWRVDLIHA
ncbi:MAG: glycosyltransferase, partial [Pseudomonadota bacterium]